MADIEIADRLDLKAVSCPLNFVKAKLKLEQLKAGQVLEVILDDGEPIQNVPRAIKEEGHRILRVEKTSDNSFRLLIEKDGGLKDGR